MPYLRRVDAARIYSNFGPLVLEFEQRLAGLLGLPDTALVSANTGTAGLVACVLALAGRATAARPLALMPAYTFVATAVAAQECGYEPYLADVRAGDWQLDAAAVASHPQLDRVGVVMPVAPYGLPVDPAPWREFERRTGIAVVIDGAASLEPASADGDRLLGEIPVVFSLHATKGLATGEGGAIACTDPARAARIGQALNFGFSGSRESRAPSTNGKMSEYHAAVGLAELDGWPVKSAATGCSPPRGCARVMCSSTPAMKIAACACSGSSSCAGSAIGSGMAWACTASPASPPVPPILCR